MPNPEEVLISDSIRITVESKVDTTFNFVPNGDVIVISAFFDSTDRELDFIQVKNMDYFVNRIWPKNLGELDTDYKSRIENDKLFKTVAAMWNSGARNILIIKAGNRSDLYGDFHNYYDIVYDKTELALSYATQFDFVSMLYSVEAEYKSLIDIVDSEQEMIRYNDTNIITFPEKHNHYFSINGLKVYKDDVLVSEEDYMIYPELKMIELNSFDENATYKIIYRKLYDFLELMANVCAKAVGYGNIIQSVLSTNENNVTNILNNEALYRKNAWQNRFCKTTVNGKSYFVPNNDKYRFVSVVHGYATISTNYNGFIFQDGLGPTILGLMSILDDDIAVSGRIIKAVRLPNILSQSEADLLSENGFIPIGGTVRRRRGLSDEIRPMADNNMAAVRSELRQTGVLRLTRRIAYNIKNELSDYIGTQGNGIKESVNTVLNGFKKRGIIRRYNFKISRPPKDPHKVLILVQYLPYFSAKVIEISIVAGRNS